MSRVIDLAIIYRREELEYPPLPPERAEYAGQKDWDAKPKRSRGPHEIRSIGWLAARAMGDRYDRDRQGIKIGGCGMDMGFSLVYDLGRTLYPRGFKVNGRGRKDGGYALKQEWL
jgi:hypothetical protein